MGKLNQNTRISVVMSQSTSVSCRVPCLQQTSNINEEQKDLKDLFRISDDLRKNMADIFILLKNKQSYKEIDMMMEIFKPFQ